MAGLGTVIAGILGGGVVVGGALVAADPLKARRRAAVADDVEEWSDGVLDNAEAARAALQMLGYGTDSTGITSFQQDANFIFAFQRQVDEGAEPTPPPDAGFTQVPPALQQWEGQPDIAQSGRLDRSTVEALADAVRAVVYATGKSCMTDEGEALEADAGECLAAWQQAVRYAYEASARTAAFRAQQGQFDDWQQATSNVTQESGTHGPYSWRTYKGGPAAGAWEGQFYFVTWKQGQGISQPAGPYGNAAAAKHAVVSYIAQQLGEPAPGGAASLAGVQVPQDGHNNGNGAGAGLGLGG